MDYQTRLFQYLLSDASGAKLRLLNLFLKNFIPFNIPHDPRILSLSKNSSEVYLPYKRKNLNHVKSIHACAMATLGEYCAGLTLLAHFGNNKYRLVLAELNCQYIYQARTSVIGKAHLDSQKFSKLKSELAESSASKISIETLIKDQKDNKVAIITSNWQLKEWKKVKTRPL